MRCFIRLVAKLSLRPVIMLAAGMVWFVPAAKGQTPRVAGEGAFTANFVGYADAETPPIQVGSGRFAGITNSIMTAMSAENAAFLHNKTGRCLGDWIVDEVAATYEQHVHCTYTDPDGDMIFERADFDRQPLNGPRVGAGRWLGGTGKYDGISGLFEIRVQGLPSARDGLVQYVGTKQGNYHLSPKAP